MPPPPFTWAPPPRPPLTDPTIEDDIMTHISLIVNDALAANDPPLQQTPPHPPPLRPPPQEKPREHPISRTRMPTLFDTVDTITTRVATFLSIDDAEIDEIAESAVREVTEAAEGTTTADASEDDAADTAANAEATEPYVTAEIAAPA